MREGFPARIVCFGASRWPRVPVSEDAGEMSFLSELAGLCPSAPRAALGWAVDFLSDNGFLSAAELAGADPKDLEGWSATAAVNVDTVLSLIKAANARKNDGAALQCHRSVARARASARARRRGEAGATRGGAPSAPEIALPAGASGPRASERSVWCTG